jgi:hypothetical protein
LSLSCAVQSHKRSQKLSRKEGSGARTRLSLNSCCKQIKVWKLTQLSNRVTSQTRTRTSTIRGPVQHGSTSTTRSDCTGSRLVVNGTNKPSLTREPKGKGSLKSKPWKRSSFTSWLPRNEQLSVKSVSLVRKKSGRTQRPRARSKR